MTCGIYKITNKITGKSYIGASENVEKRWSRHKSDLRKNNHHNPPLQKSWDKYGENNFELKILEKCPKEELLLREQYYVKLDNTEWIVVRDESDKITLMKKNPLEEKISHCYLLRVDAKRRC